MRHFASLGAFCPFLLSIIGGAVSSPVPAQAPAAVHAGSQSNVVVVHDKFDNLKYREFCKQREGTCWSNLRNFPIDRFYGENPFPCQFVFPACMLYHEEIFNNELQKSAEKQHHKFEKVKDHVYRGLEHRQKNFHRARLELDEARGREAALRDQLETAQDSHDEKWNRDHIERNLDKQVRMVRKLSEKFGEKQQWTEQKDTEAFASLNREDALSIEWDRLAREQQQKTQEARDKLDNTTQKMRDILQSEIRDFEF